MTQVTPEEIRHLAGLSRLKLSETEVARLGHDLPRIVEFVDGLRQVPLTDEPLIGNTVPLEALRADEVSTGGLTLSQLQHLAPGWEDNQLVVPAVFGEESDAA